MKIAIATANDATRYATVAGRAGQRRTRLLPDGAPAPRHARDVAAGHVPC